MTDDELLIDASKRRCAACRRGEPVSCDGWKYVYDPEASNWYGEPHYRRERCTFYLKRFAKQCAERAARDAGLPLSYARVLEPEVDERLEELVGLTVVYPEQIDPKATYRGLQITQQAAWYHAMAGHRPYYVLVPAVTFDDLEMLDERFAGEGAVFLDRWDGGHLHPFVLAQLCTMFESRTANEAATVVSLLQPVGDLRPRVPDEAAVIYRLREATAIVVAV